MDGQYNMHCDFFALYLVRQGRGTHIIDDVAHGISRGDLYVMKPEATHAYTHQTGLELDSIYFSTEALTPEWSDALRAMPGFLPLFDAREGIGGRWLHLGPGPYESIRSMIQELRREWSGNTLESVSLARALFFRLFVHLARISAASPTTTQASCNAVSNAVRIIDARFAEPLRIEAIARAQFLSPDRFTRLFAESMGRTPRDYLRHVRMEQAKRLLRETDLPIGDIGVRVGFVDASHFTRAFRQETGRSPKSFRSGDAG
jgi:hypothetical protein